MLEETTAGPRSPDGDTEGRLAAFARTRDPRLRDRILADHDALAVSLARRFSTGREATEDLVQVARIGLIQALERFDPGRERPFVVFARATILGELKRHLRDRTWRIRPTRAQQENWLIVFRSLDDLTQELGRSPRIGEIAARAGLTDEQVLEAMEVGRVQPLSLDAPAGGDEDGGFDRGLPDAGFGHAESRMVTAAILATLTERDRLVFRLRFVDQLTQSEIAARVGLSQMAVSRILARNLSRLRIRFDGAGIKPG